MPEIIDILVSMNASLEVAVANIQIRNSAGKCWPFRPTYHRRLSRWFGVALDARVDPADSQGLFKWVVNVSGQKSGVARNFDRPL